MKIRPLEMNDFGQWLPLWDGNNMGVRDEAVTRETWARLCEKESAVNGLGAFDGNTLSGFVHYIVHPTTGAVENVAYMQDLYVDPAQRKKGIARALVKELEKTGRKQRWARIYWYAEGRNEAAQNLYKNLGHKLDFTLHIMPLKD